MSERIVLLGAGGHARVLADLLRLLGMHVAGYVGGDEVPPPGVLAALAYLGNDEALVAAGPSGVTLVNAVGGTDVATRRRTVFEKFAGRGFPFATLVHPSAVVAADARLDEGAQVMAGAVVQSGARVGPDAIVNTRAVVDHDCDIAGHVHVASGAVIAGGVAIGEASHIGAGATVIQNIAIGREVLVAAGAVVVEDIPDGARVAGVPARPFQSRA